MLSIRARLQRLWRGAREIMCAGKTEENNFLTIHTATYLSPPNV